jgi:hypothetical protein
MRIASAVSLFANSVDTHCACVGFPPHISLRSKAITTLLHNIFDQDDISECATEASAMAQANHPLRYIIIENHPPKQASPITCAVLRVYDDTCTVIETHEHTGDFKEW